MAKKIGRITRIRQAALRWFDYKNHKRFWSHMATMGQTYFVPRANTESESFEAKAKQLGLSEQDIEARKKGLLLNAVLFSILTLLVFCYAVSMFISKSLPGALVALVLSGVCLVFTIRFHFWYYQFKTRRLGCRLSEWFSKGILGRKS